MMRFDPSNLRLRCDTRLKKQLYFTSIKFMLYIADAVCAELTNGGRCDGGWDGGCCCWHGGAAFLCFCCCFVGGWWRWWCGGDSGWWWWWCGRGGCCGGACATNMYTYTANPQTSRVVPVHWLRHFTALRVYINVLYSNECTLL